MSLASRAVEFLARIQPAQTRDVAVRRDIEIVMPDGVTLRGDRYWARGGAAEPVIVMRSPYGRTGIWALGARVFAERGYQVVLQSCRGTGGSGGDFNAYRHEVEDGLATLAWVGTAAVVLREGRDVRSELPRDRAVGDRHRPALVVASDGRADLVGAGARVHLPRRDVLARQHDVVAAAARRAAS